MAYKLQKLTAYCSGNYKYKIRVLACQLLPKSFIWFANFCVLTWQKGVGNCFRPLLTLYHFYRERGNTLFSLEETLTLDMNLASLHAIILPKLLSAVSRMTNPSLWYSTLHCF